MVDPKQRQPDSSRQKGQPGSFKPRDGGIGQRDLKGRPMVGNEASPPNNNFRSGVPKTPEETINIYNLGKNLIRALSNCEAVLDIINSINSNDLDSGDAKKLILINQRAEALDKALLQAKGLALDEMLQIDLALKKVALDTFRMATKNNFVPTDPEWEKEYREDLLSIKNFALENEIMGQRELDPGSVQESGELTKSIGLKVLRPNVLIKTKPLKDASGPGMTTVVSSVATPEKELTPAEYSTVFTQMMEKYDRGEPVTETDLVAAGFTKEQTATFLELISD